ncbi:SCO family protein [Aquabacterium humicola]|uniref:SCO family protein n=1 Tax=Aquabacterium humicola TaxID=3237377 RepID=UPI002543B7FE|nr:SCO family protein [Rubrivivax pictus]
MAASFGRQLRRAAMAALLAAALPAATPAAAAGAPRLDQRAAIEASQAVIGTQPPDFVMLDRAEAPVRLSRFRGKPVLVNFIYTGCFTACPLQTRTLADSLDGLQRLLGADRFHVVSIGFNQPFDSPPVLRAFASQHGIDMPNWEFLAPKTSDIVALTRAFGFEYTQTTDGFEHAVAVTVLDAEGRIRAQVYGERLTAETLGQPLRDALLAAPPARTLPTLDELVTRVKILCTVYDPATGRYRTDWKLIAELIAGLAFFATVGGWLWRGRRGPTPPPAAS